MPRKPASWPPRKPAPKCGWGDDSVRGTRSERGYDDSWLRLRAAYLAEHPLCERCEAEGRAEPSVEVHHVRAFLGREDPLRLDGDNLQALCRPCHRHLTAGRRHKGRQSPPHPDRRATGG